MTDAVTITDELIAWASSVTWAGLPEPVRDATTARVVDSLGLMLAGSDTDAGRAVLSYATSVGGAPTATVLGTALRLPPEGAALVHGVWAHVHDFDDTEPSSVIHPTSPVAAAALAVGEAEGRSPEDVLAAIAVGVEVMCRLGAPAGRRFHHRGFHATGLVAPFAAALTTGLLRGDDPAVIRSALGLAGSTSGGLLAFLADGTWAKRLHPGWGAHAGVTAAGLARHGFLGPAPVLEDRFGFYAAFLHGEDVEATRVVDGLGSSWVSLPVHLKRFPCAHVIQPFLDAVLGLGLDADDVEEFVLRLPSWQVPIVCEPWATKVGPTSEYQARTSLPFAAASAIVDGTVDIDTFDEAKLGRPEVAALLGRFRYEVDDALDGFDGAITIRRRDGETHTTAAPHTEPPLVDGLRAKLPRTAGRVLTSTHLDALLAALDPGSEPFDAVGFVRSLA